MYPHRVPGEPAAMPALWRAVTGRGKGPSMSTCPNCGAQVGEGWKFCGTCGATASAEMAPAAVAAPSEAPQSAAPQYEAPQYDATLNEAPQYDATQYPAAPPPAADDTVAMAPPPPPPGPPEAMAYAAPVDPTV